MIKKTSLLVIAMMLAGCSAEVKIDMDEAITTDGAKAFVAAVEKDLAEKGVFEAQIEWVKANFITEDTRRKKMACI